MCIAALEASTLPCHHRWYRLHQSCNPALNLHLGNCPHKLQLHGWEARMPDCPFCNESSLQTEEYRLIGGGGGIATLAGSVAGTGAGSEASSIRSRSTTPSLSRHLSQTRRHSNRRGSTASSASSGSGAGSTWTDGGAVEDDIAAGTFCSITHATGTKNRAMNMRLDTYVSSAPFGGISAVVDDRSGNFGLGKVDGAGVSSPASTPSPVGGMLSTRVVPVLPGIRAKSEKRDGKTTKAKKKNRKYGLPFLK